MDPLFIEKGYIKLMAVNEKSWFSLKFSCLAENPFSTSLRPVSDAEIP
jgi:hypothetical protein